MTHDRRLTNTVRSRRERAGLAQHQLAARVGTSRQTLAAIEAARTVPGTALALRLAAALGCAVEDLFHLPGPEPEATMPARLVGTPHPAGAPRDSAAPHPAGTAPPIRVKLSLAAGRAVAIPLAGTLASVAALSEADGVVSGGRGTAVRVRLLASRERLAETVVVTGCDPALPVVAAQLRRSHPACGLTWLPSGSLQALRWLREGAAHIAGIHLRDPRTGQENVPLVRRLLGGRRALVLGFATWEEGLIVAAGNRRGIHGVADLARLNLAIINREAGSGARALLDAALAAAGVPAARIRGYDRLAYSHLAVAQAVALGLVDAGVGVRAAAQAFGLSFIPLQRERYDLVVPAALLNHPPVQAFLEACRSAAVRSDLEAVGEYDMSQFGTTRARLP